MQPLISSFFRLFILFMVCYSFLQCKRAHHTFLFHLFAAVGLKYFKLLSFFRASCMNGPLISIPSDHHRQFKFMSTNGIHDHTAQLVEFKVLFGSFAYESSCFPRIFQFINDTRDTVSMPHCMLVFTRQNPRRNMAQGKIEYQFGNKQFA